MLRVREWPSRPQHLFNLTDTVDLKDAPIFEWLECDNNSVHVSCSGQDFVDVARDCIFSNTETCICFTAMSILEVSPSYRSLHFRIFISVLTDPVRASYIFDICDTISELSADSSSSSIPKCVRNVTICSFVNAIMGRQTEQTMSLLYSHTRDRQTLHRIWDSNIRQLKFGRIQIFTRSDSCVSVS